MAQDVVPSNQQDNPFGGRGMAVGGGINAGSVAIEQERAIAEAQGQLVLAKKFPRDLNGAYAELMSACSNRAFAEAAFYSVPNRGSGPSIRFAEEVARVYGNFQYGHRELSRDDGKSEVEVYAWDMQQNNRSIRQITVRHVTDTRNGPKVLRDQADIDNKIANVASKQVRGRIMALMPKWLVEEGIAACKKTLAGDADEPIEVRVRKMTRAFGRYGVNQAALERYLGHSLTDVVADELADLLGVFNALNEGAPVRDYFPAEEDGEDDEKAMGASLAKAAENGQRQQQARSSSTKTSTTKKQDKAAESKPDPEPQRDPEPTDNSTDQPDESTNREEPEQPVNDSDAQSHGGDAEDDSDVF